MSDSLTSLPTPAELLTEALRNGGRLGEFIYDFTLQPVGFRALSAAAPATRRAA